MLCGDTHRDVEGGYRGCPLVDQDNISEHYELAFGTLGQVGLLAIVNRRVHSFNLLGLLVCRIGIGWPSSRRSNTEQRAPRLAGARAMFVELSSMCSVRQRRWSVIPGWDLLHSKAS